MPCDDTAEYGDANKEIVNGEKQMKILVISDVHGTDYWKSCIDKVDEYDKIVQMGDWFDDWTNDWDKVDQIKNLEEALAFQSNYKEKVHILVGNHDLNSYLMKESVSGHQTFKEVDIYHTLKEHIDEMNVAVEIGGWVFSHAGFTKTWMKLHSFNSIEEVNDAFHNYDFEPFKFYGWDVTGNDITQGPTWVRIDSLILDYYFDKQVVGHTPLKNPPFICHKNGLDLVVVDDEKHKCQYELII